MSWFLNEERVPYEYDPARQEGDFPNDYRTAYATREEAEAAAAAMDRKDSGVTNIDELVAQAIARTKQEILRDIAEGAVPTDVGTFSELHDYVDANVYGGLCDGGLFRALWDHGNEVQGSVDGWLQDRLNRAERLSDSCETDVGTGFIRQNLAVATGLTENDLDLVDEHATLYSGGLIVMLRDLGDGWYVKLHDSWGPWMPSEGELSIVVHVYDADADPDEDDGVAYYADGAEALQAFLAATKPPEED